MGGLTMPRQKRERWLPDNVTPYKDRHGKVRYRFRKRGLKTYHFKNQPGSPEFMEELFAAQQKQPISGGHAPYSMDDLAHKMFAAPKFRGMQANSQYTYRRIIERYLDTVDSKTGKRYGTYPAKRATVEGLDKHIGNLSDTPAAANNLRKALKRLFKYANKIGWMQTNPADLTDLIKSDKEGGFHTWTDDEIARYRAHWPYGSVARLTFEIALNNAARRCNLALIERDDLVNGRWRVKHAKGNDETSVALSPECALAIEALPVAPIRYFITSRKGTPYSIESLGNVFRKWAIAAGCPGRLHGIRKGVSRIAAEHGVTSLEGRSLTGHKKDATFEYYAEKSNRALLADNATAKMIGEPRLANPEND